MRRVTEVVTPAADLSLVSLALAKDELEIPAGEIVQDARLLRYIRQCSADVHSFCRRIFPVQTYRDSFIIDGSVPYPQTTETTLQLSNYPVVQTLSVTGDATTLSADDYRLDLDRGRLGLVSTTGSLYRGWPQTVVEYKAGFAVIPDDVVEATLRLVTLRYHLRGRDPMLKMRDGPTYGREEFWVGSMPSMSSGLPNDIAQKLDNYVPVRIG